MGDCESEMVSIVIEGTERRFKCPTNMTIGEAEEGIRKDYYYQYGLIELNGDSTRSGKTFAEEIEDVIGEGIGTLQFNNDKIINSEGKEFIFTFVNGENGL